jgi:hypothetical protein
MKNEAVPMLLNGILINPQKEYAKPSISQVHHFLFFLINSTSFSYK